MALSDSRTVEGPERVMGQEFSYGEHELQTLTVFDPFGNRLHDDERYWIIYIHGGAWRDPKVTDKSLLPVIESILSQSEHRKLTAKNVAAFASVSYRLSAHPLFPQDPEVTPRSQLRDASHPDHLIDVLSSIAFLQFKFGFGNKYILVGHSCGATLALQAAMRKYLLQENHSVDVPNPEVIIGVAGIYDMRLLCDCHEEKMYESFTVAAFGPDEALWDAVSPAKFEYFKETWPEGKRLALISSTGDNLVDEKQIQAMIHRSQDLTMEIDVIQDLQEAHNDIWAKGSEMARVICTVLKKHIIEAEPVIAGTKLES